MGETGDGIKEYTYHDEKSKTNKKYINIFNVLYHSYFCHLLFLSCLLPSICDVCYNEDTVFKFSKYFEHLLSAHIHEATHTLFHLTDATLLNRDH